MVVVNGPEMIVLGKNAMNGPVMTDFAVNGPERHVM